MLILSLARSEPGDTPQGRIAEEVPAVVHVSGSWAVVVGLLVGLAAGRRAALIDLVVGTVPGLVVSPVFGQVVRLAVGLVVEPVIGLVIGMMVGMVVRLAVGR